MIYDEMNVFFISFINVYHECKKTQVCLKNVFNFCNTHILLIQNQFLPY